MYKTVASEKFNALNSISPVGGSVDVTSLLYLNSNVAPPNDPSFP